MAEYKTKDQVNYGWGLSLNMTGKAPAIAKRIWSTLADATAYINDPNDSAIAGLHLSVISDSDATKNGIYFVQSVGTADASGVLVKVGSDSEAELGELTADVRTLEGKVNTLDSSVSNLETAIADKANEFTVGDGLAYTSDKIDIVIDPSSVGLTKSAAGLKVVVPEVTIPEYSVIKLGEPEAGAAASYQLTKDGEGVGAVINVPKDMVVESGTVETVTEADVPYEGAKVGDKYIDMVIANTESSHLYIPVNDLVDVYVGSVYIDVTGNTISIKYNELKTQLLSDASTAFNIGAMDASIAKNANDITTISGKVDNLETSLNDPDSGVIKDVTDLKTNVSNINNSITRIDGSVGTLTTDLTTVKSDITTLKNTVGDDTKGLVKDVTDLKTQVSTNTESISNLSNTLQNKLDNDAVVNGKSFVDNEGTPTVTLVAGDINTDASVGPNAPGTDIQSVLINLDSRIRSAESGGIKSIISGNKAIVVNAENVNNPTITFTLVADASVASITEQGLKIEDTRSKWVQL